MMKKTTLSLIKSLLFLGVFFFTFCQSNAQTTISASKFDFVNICAGDIVNGIPFNEYYATFTYSGFPSDVIFAVEISDENGNFLSTPVLAKELELTKISATQQKIKFAIPTTLKGSDTYSLRIRSNISNASTSQRIKNFVNNDSFSVYYKNYVDSFSINNQAPTATFCSGGSMTLSIDNSTPSVKESSPVNYPNLKFIWYKDDVVIPGQTAASLSVNAGGSYYVKIDYGKCSDNNFSSNRVTVNSASGSGSTVSISSSLGNPFCANGGSTILTATSGNTYIWKKDGVVISGATSRTYSTNESGVYTVDVNFGGCSGSGNINLMSNSFDASIDVAEETSIGEGETLSVTVTDDASNPTYEWFLNGNAIQGATSDTYLISFRGNYKVKISQAGGCISSREFSFKVNGPPGLATVIPNIIKLGSSYWNIPDEFKNENTKVIIISSNGEKVLDVVNYQGDWPQTGIDIKNINPVYYYVIQGDAGEKKGSITVLK
ncbi:gliding motility protein SprC [Flavobacterium sp. W22_SRS_FK3]|uniref:gliding motility protein SprC n=1 Tax=Flavobacterium sp. W22_SRS_FK3 TaxID=3240275 RepID=UPI003F914898